MTKALSLTDFPAPLRKRLDGLAATTGRPVRTIVRQAVESYLEDLEDVQAATAAMKRAKSSRPYKEIARDLGLDR